MVGTYSRLSGGNWYWKILYEGSELTSGYCASSGEMKEVLEMYSDIEWRMV